MTGYRFHQHLLVQSVGDALFLLRLGQYLEDGLTSAARHCPQSLRPRGLLGARRPARIDRAVDVHHGLAGVFEAPEAH